MDSDEDNTKEKRKHVVIKNSTDLQRMKLEKLMQNPEKPVIIPERPKPRGVPVVPDFVRNVMGSSAGAGSGEFHVYRHLRRKEYARQKYMQEKGERERLDEEYRKKLEQNRLEAEAKTAKRRAKRLKKKKKNKKPKLDKKSSGSDCESISNEEECQDEEDDTKNSKHVDENTSNDQSENENSDRKPEINIECKDTDNHAEVTADKHEMVEVEEVKDESELKHITNCDENVAQEQVLSNNKL